MFQYVNVEFVIFREDEYGDEIELTLAVEGIMDEGEVYDWSFIPTMFEDAPVNLTPGEEEDLEAKLCEAYREPPERERED